MAITIPTIDDFKEETVMTVIRKVVDYLIEQLVPEINDNDVTNASLSLAGDIVTMRLTMGDGTYKTSSVSLSKYATDADLNALEDYFNALEPELSISGNTLTVTINGKSSSVVLPASGSGIDTISARSSGSVSTISFAEGSDNKLTMVISPSTTDADNAFKITTITPSATGEAELTFVNEVTGSVSGNNLTIGVNGVESDPIALPSSGGDANGLTMNASGKVDVSTSDTGVNYQLNSSGNNMTLVGNIVVGSTNNAIYNDTATIINSVSGSVSNGNLRITVNGVESGDIPLPKSETFSRNTNDDTVYVQLHKENDTTVTSPTLGIEVWETLDLENLPTNFTDGTELLISILPSATDTTTTDWNTAPTASNTPTNKTADFVVRIRLRDANIQASNIQSTYVNSSAISGVELLVESVEHWNATSDNILQLVPFTFNGAGLQEGSGISINRTNITTYIESIKRKL